MMDMGMYGSYGKPDSYAGYGYPAQSNQLAGHVSVPSSPESASTHYYPQPAIAPYSSVNETTFLGDNTPSQSFYSPSATIHEDGTVIIQSENGLSYTNLDYTSSSSSSPSYPAGHPCHAPQDHHHGYHVSQTLYRDEHCHGTIHQSLIHQRHEHDLHQQSSHEHDYQISVAGSSNYLHHIPDENLHYGQGAVRQDFGAHTTGHFKEESPDTSGYHLQTGHVQHGHAHPHLHQQQTHHPQQHQPSRVPTYKWMQVKRNVPKPSGEIFFGLNCF